MDGHEWGNMVKGNKQILQPGMCFMCRTNHFHTGRIWCSLEDCAYMTNEGPKWFSQPAKSINEHFA
jgi:Xaa-Pro dipeptidase